MISSASYLMSYNGHIALSSCTHESASILTLRYAENHIMRRSVLLLGSGDRISEDDYKDHKMNKNGSQEQCNHDTSSFGFTCTSYMHDKVDLEIDGSTGYSDR